MAQSTGKSATGGKGGTLLPLLPWILIPVAIVCFSIFSMFSSNGASAAQTTDTSPGSADQMPLDSLMAYTKPDDFLTAKASDIASTISQLQTLQTNIKQNGARYAKISAADKTTALGLITEMITDLQTIPGLAKTDKAKATTTASNFIADRIKLATLVPLSNAQLDVPVVDQGQPDWCGRTSAMMVALYYQFKLGHSDGGPAAVGFKNVNGRLTSTNPGFMQLEAGFLGRVTGHPWTNVSMNGNPDKIISEIKSSIDGGDPVIIYTDNLIYSGSNHIVVVTGYNTENNTLIINNAAILAHGGTKKNSSVGRGKQPLTESFVKQEMGTAQSHYGHVLMISSKYAR